MGSYLCQGLPIPRATSPARAPLGQAMPSGELGTASAGCRCCRCGRRCQKREAKVLRCLLALCFAGMLALALPVLYFLSRRVSEEPAQEEIPTGRMPDPQRRQGVPPCDCSDPNFRPSIHVAVTKQNDSSKNCSASQYPPVYWYKHQQEGEGQIKLDEGIYLVIPKDGEYFVYSQVTFFCSDGTCKNVMYCEKKVVSSMVSQMISYQTSAYDGNPTIVFTSSSSITETKWSKTLYLGGIIQLKKDDKLMVNVSNPALIREDIRLTFFGAYLIS